MNIEKYSDWLVASDVDGTILNKRRKLVKKNIDAVADFVKEGGNFTLASGRNPQLKRLQIHVDVDESFFHLSIPILPLM